MDKEDWLANWANTVSYESTDDLFRKVFNDIVVNQPFENTEVVYRPSDEDDTVVIELIGEVNSKVTLPKK